MAERGLRAHHATLNRWVTKYSPMIAARAQSMKRPTPDSRRMEEHMCVASGCISIALPTREILLISCSQSEEMALRRPSSLPKHCHQTVS